MGVIGSAASFIILICVLVTVHELGHFIVARMNGVYVEAFSIGMGPVLFEKQDKLGTNWRISLLPIGGYVKMLGDSDITSVKESMPSGYTDADMDRMSMHRKKPWQKLFIAGAGPFANFIFSIIVLFSLASINGIPEYSNKIVVQDEKSVAYESGLRTHDIVINANGNEVSRFRDIKEQLDSTVGNALALTVKRGDEIVNLSINMYTEVNGEKKPISVIGIRPEDMSYRKAGLVESAVSAISSTYSIAVDNIRSVFNVVCGSGSAKSIGGIVSIFKMSVDSADAGFSNFIWTLAVFSTVLGAINLLPIPVLDGGTVVISAIEMIVGRPLNKKFIEFIFMVGLVVVLAIMLLGLWNDLSNCKFFVWLENLFK
jgi:regulator of sigma E protease